MNERHTVLDSITSAFVPIHPEGHKFILGFAVAALILFLLAPPLGWLSVIATLACATSSRRFFPIANSSGRAAR